MPDPTNKMKADHPWTCAGCGAEQGGPKGHGHRGVNDHIRCLNERIAILDREMKRLTDANALLEQELAPYRKIRAEVADTLARFPDRARGKRNVAAG